MYSEVQFSTRSQLPSIDYSSMLIYYDAFLNLKLVASVPILPILLSLVENTAVNKEINIFLKMSKLKGE